VNADGQVQVSTEARAALDTCGKRSGLQLVVRLERLRVGARGRLDADSVSPDEREQLVGRDRAQYGLSYADRRDAPPLPFDVGRGERREAMEYLAFSLG
jgi:hypothetical protein